MGDTNGASRKTEPQPKSTPDTARRNALENTLRTLLPLLSFDELRVVDVIVTRTLKLGRESYAPLDLARDERDWGKEAAEELADTLFYLACREVSANDRRLERLRCEVADEIAANIEPGLRELARVAPDENAIDTERFDHGGEG
jgi:hypothetical protein